MASGFGARAQMDLARAAPPAAIAAGALAAMARGRGGTVRPGALAKLLGWSLATAPRPLRVRIMGKIMAGLTRAQAR